MVAAGAPVFPRMFEQGQGVEEDAKSASSSVGEQKTRQLTRLSPPLALSPAPPPSPTRPSRQHRQSLAPTPTSVAQLFGEESTGGGTGTDYAEEKQSQPPGGGGGGDVAPSSNVTVGPVATARKSTYGTIFGERAAAAGGGGGGGKGAQGGASGAGGAMGLVLGTDGSGAPDTGVNIPSVAATAPTRGVGTGELPAVEVSQSRAGSIPSSPVLFEGMRTLRGVGKGRDSFLRSRAGSMASLLPSQASSRVPSPDPFEEPEVLSRLLGEGDGSLPGSGGPQEKDEEEERIVAPEVGVIEAMGQEDDGTGVFGAIFHEPGEVLEVARQGGEGRGRQNKARVDTVPL